MALTNWNDILNKPNGIDEVPEIALTVEQLSASVLSLGEDVGEIAGDVQEIALDVSQLSASNLPYNAEQSTKQKIDEVNNNFPYKTLLLENAEITFNNSNFSSSVNISTLTDGRVTKDNIKVIISNGVGVDGYPNLTSNKSLFSIISANTLTGTYNYNLLFIY